VLRYLDQPAVLLGILIALCVGILAHNAAQVLVASALGDPLPRRSGRLTWRPEKQASIFSAVAMVIVGVGWAEPVPMSDHWRRLRYKVSAAVLAGPIAYALLAAITLAAMRGAQPVVLVKSDRWAGYVSDSFSAKLLAAMAFTFCALTVLSLIPLPPTDGGRLLFTLGGTSPGWGNARYQLEERNFGLALILAILLLPIVFAGFPSVVGQLAPEMYKGLANLFNAKTAVLG
jgi:Zn-dependent protease